VSAISSTIGQDSIVVAASGPIVALSSLISDSQLINITCTFIDVVLDNVTLCTNYLNGTYFCLIDYSSVGFTFSNLAVICGDNLITGNEVCDGNAQSCTINGYLGTQSCNSQCSGWDSCVSSLVGYWNADGNTLDSSWNGNNGTWVGIENYSAGKYGQAFNFDGGSNTYVDIPYSPVFNFESNDFTIGAWINPDLGFIAGQCGEGMFVDRIGGNDFAWSFFLNAAGKLIFQARNSADYVDYRYYSDSALVSNQWQYVVVQRSNNRIKFYVDGKELNSSGQCEVMCYPMDDTKIDYTIKSSSVSLWLGNHHNNPACGLSGGLDEVRIFNRAFSVQEINSLYLYNSFCGDGVCNNGETCSSCSADCGSCSTGNTGNTGSSGSSGREGGGGGSPVVRNLSNNTGLDYQPFNQTSSINDTGNQNNNLGGNQKRGLSDQMTIIFYIIAALIVIVAAIIVAVVLKKNKTKVQQKSESKLEHKVEKKIEKKVELKIDKRAELKPKPKIEVKPQPKIELKPKPESKLAPKPQSKLIIKPQPQQRPQQVQPQIKSPANIPSAPISNVEKINALSSAADIALKQRNLNGAINAYKEIEVLYSKLTLNETKMLKSDPLDLYERILRARRTG
jgi:hypothetical protein